MATFGDPPRGRLHWLPAGLIGGLSILLYWAFIVFGALGVLALAVLTWRASPDRARYVRHVALTVVVALVVASWYLIPYLGWGLLHGSSQVEYQYQGGGIQDSPLLFLSPTPLGVLELIGVIGLVWWRGRVWWGKPLLLLTGGIYAYWLLGLASFVLANHTPAAAGHPPADRPGAGGGGGADHRAGRPRRRAPALHPAPSRPGCRPSACACSSSGPPSPHGRRGCRAALPRRPGCTSPP